jgi:CheY-like chemotaxis protein
MDFPQWQAGFSGQALRAGANGSKLILSVDDEPSILFTREQILQSEGYDVCSAEDGETALHIFVTQAVDLVLLDYAMPGMDGGTVAHEMKRHKPLVPVIMVSASAVPEDGSVCADCFIRKGEGPRVLIEAIRKILAPASGIDLPDARAS